MSTPSLSDDLSHLEYSVILRISKIMLQGNHFKKDLMKVLELLKTDLGMERGVVSVIFKEADMLHVDVSLGMNNQKEVGYLMGEGITGSVAESGQPVAVLNIDNEPLFLDRTGTRDGLDRSTISFLCVPITFSDSVVGVLSIDHARPSGNEDLNHELLFLEEVAMIIASRVRTRQEELKNDLLKNKSYKVLNIVGNSSAMRQLYEEISRVADSSTSVLITGETGTGKEVIAREIHNRSPRRNRALVKINCGAIPENLIESELFGHEKGAFTGAVSLRKGRFEMAKGGSIFLDEVGELPANAQVKLLRILQEREFERVGGSETVRVNVRVIAATNRSLEQEVQEKNFRADLFYRLNVFPIHSPALRERGADVILLANHFVQKFSAELDKEVSRIDTPALDMMMAYHWPGNVRELENTIERAVLLSDDDVIHGHHLPPSLQLKKTGGARIEGEGNFETLVQNYERELIIEALKEAWGNQTEAAKLLGTTKRVVQYKIHKLEIDYKRYARGPKNSG